jgi:hypothetical protein
MCRGRRETNRTALPERCRAPYTLAQALDAFVWDDLCRVLTEPVLIVHAFERAHKGEWLPQALQARLAPSVRPWPSLSDSKLSCWTSISPRSLGARSASANAR